MGATNRHRSLQLTPEQERALPLVLAGQSDRQVGEAVGRDRVTVTRWRTRNPAFMAALNAERKAMIDAAAERLRGLAGRALDAIERELDDPERPTGRLALELLRSLGLLDPRALKSVGPATVNEILDRHVRGKRSAVEYGHLLEALSPGEGAVSQPERSQALDELLDDEA